MAKTLAGVLAVSIAALLIAGCTGARTINNDSQSKEPVVEIGTWCDFLDATVALYISVEKCLIDEDVRKSMPTTEQELEDRARYYLVRLNYVNKCYLMLGMKYEQDSSRVAECTRHELQDLRFALMAEISGFNDVVGLFGLFDDGKQARSEGGYLINGDVYNDPWGFDYRNDSNDLFGDGR